MIISGITQYSRLAVLFVIAFALTACGGGGGGGDGGGFLPDPDTPNKLALNVTIDKDSVPVNVAQRPAEADSPHVSQIAVEVTDSGTGLPVVGAEVSVSFTGTRVGGLLSEEDLAGGIAESLSSVSVQTAANGDARIFFVAGTVDGEANLRIRAERSAEGSTTGGAEVAASILVVSSAGPVSALEFTGPFIEAIRTNRTEVGLAPDETVDFQNGTYSRVVSVTATDANGNPVATNTPVLFRLIDAPLDGYPESGAGSFSIKGFNGNPLEGNFSFDASGASFIAAGTRVGDRLALDADPDGRSFYHAGIRTISELPDDQPGSLLIHTDEEPFRVGEDQGANVPYVIGRARVGNIQSLAFTDANGTASTLLTYPFSNVGRTALLVAQTEDFSVSRVFNPGGPVYLGSLEEDGLTLTASTTTLASNVTNGRVALCVRDGNQVPLPAQSIQFGVGDTFGATVDVNGKGASGTLVTGSGGCTTAVVNVSDQLPGSDEISLLFSVQSLGEPSTVEVIILASGSGNLIGNLNCSSSTLGLIYLTDSGEPIPNALISASDFSWPSGSPNFLFTPASDGGSSAGVTDSNGAVGVRYSITLPQPEEDDQTVTYTATFEAGGGDAQFDFECGFTVAGTGPATDPQLVIQTSTLPDATDGSAYSTLLESSGGQSGSQKNWTLVFNDGAAGLSVSNSGTSGALLSWASPVTGSYDIVVEVSDQGGQVVSKTLNLEVVDP
jgi:hypothetical protein